VQAVQCLLSGIPPAGLNGGFINLRAQGDAVCQALVATQEDVVEAKNKLKKTEKQLEATQATQIDEEAQSTLNELFDKLVQAHKNCDYKISPRCARRLCANAQSRGQDPRVDAACDILQLAGGTAIGEHHVQGRPRAAGQQLQGRRGETSQVHCACEAWCEPPSRHDMRLLVAAWDGISNRMRAHRKTRARPRRARADYNRPQVPAARGEGLARRALQSRVRGRAGRVAPPELQPRTRARCGRCHSTYLRYI
jgi:hypothetical protein